MASLPAFFITAQMSAVRRSCQTMALWIGLPVARSQIIVVSRWLVIPIASGMPPRDRASSTMADVTSTVVCQISSGSCSTQPSAGKCCENSADRCARMVPASSKRMARELVVPWSMAMMVRRSSIMRRFPSASVFLCLWSS